MKQLMILLLICIALTVPVSAMEFDAPVPEGDAQKYIPEESETFGQGLWKIIKLAIIEVSPELTAAASVCFSVIAIVILTATVRGLSDKAASPTELAAVCAIGGILVSASGALIRLGLDTVTELSQYSKLLLPVLTGALAAQGGVSSSVSLYTGTTVFIGIITVLITNLITPLLYALIAVCVASNAVGGDLLKEIEKFIKWLILWILKLSIYIFTGYISITGVVTGTTDASAIIATKIAMSGFVPVVGGVIADASDAVLQSAAAMKNAAGIYGIFATLSILIVPFFKVGVHYLLFKMTAAICGVFGKGNAVSLIRGFTSVMGYILGLIGSVSVMILIGTVCFMKGLSQ